MFCSVALAAALATPTLQDPGAMLDQALKAVVKGSKEAIEKTEVGFRPGICVLGAYIRAGGSVRFGSTFDADRSYVVTAGGNDSAEDIDVAIEGPDGSTLAEDDTEDAYAVAVVEPGSKRKVSYVVTNAGSKAAFVCVTILVSQGGWDIHPNNIDGILEKCKTISQLSRSEGYRFYAAKGTWCLYGGLIEQGKSIKAVKIGLAKGQHAILGFGDGEASDYSLLVTDANDRVVGQEQKGDDFPAFDFPAAYFGPTSIELKNRKGKASFSMFAILETG